MNLSELITTLPLQPEPGQRWAVLGQETEAFAARLKIRPEAILPHPEAITPAFDHFLLAGALSAEAEPVAWLKRLSQALPEGATLAVIDWQGDGPLDQGPDLERRFKRGKLYRLLRQAEEELLSAELDVDALARTLDRLATLPLDLQQPARTSPLALAFRSATSNT